MESDIFTQDDYIQEGVSPAPGVLVVACTVGDDYDNPKNRVAIKRSESWLEFSTSGEAVLSVDATGDGMAYVLGENGSVVQFDWRSPQTIDELRASRALLVIGAVENLGPLRRVRIIGGELICAGSCGQVYHLKNGNFDAFPKLLIDGEDLTVEDISGTSPSDLVAVTSDGFGAWFNGSEWYNLDLPTNASLTSICALNDGRYAISGKKGTLIVGTRDQWEIVTPIDSERSYWGIAAREDVIYAAHLAGIDVLHGKDLDSLSIPGADKLQFTVLVNGPDGVWSFAGHTIGIITAEGWRTVVHW